jgi:hypothetical protein
MEDSVSPAKKFVLFGFLVLSIVVVISQGKGVRGLVPAYSSSLMTWSASESMP